MSPEPDLPAEVLRRLVELAADALGRIEPDDAPPSLRKVREFTPARRARAAAGQLATALRRDPSFRQRTGLVWRETDPDLAQALEGGEVAPGVEAVELAAGAYLLRPVGWEAVLAGAGDELRKARATKLERKAERAAKEQVARLTSELQATQSALESAREQLAAAVEDAAAARRAERRLRADHDRAHAAVRQARDELAKAHLATEAEKAELQERVRVAEQLAEQAAEREQAARRAAREGRSMQDLRARLLLDTLVGAASGLRRELALPPVEQRPADLVDAVRADPGDPGADVGPRALPPDDPALLDALLALPRAHLVIDGYNVTKSAWEAQPLAEQRRRLVEGLTALAARTGAEVTCCFDGADLGGRVPSTGNRQVRVLFSAAGETADELIRRLVRAEPPGRPVVVVSADGEVVAGVRAAGARTVPPGALLRRLSRG